MPSLRPVAGGVAEVDALVRTWVAEGGDPIVIRTSGSSGEPKDVVLSHAAVLASARATLDRLGGPGRWLLGLPVTGIAGLQVLVRSALADTAPVVLADHPTLADALAAFEPDARRYAAVVPTQLFRWAESGNLVDLAGFDAVLVGGAPLDPTLMATAQEAGVRIVRTYGMTETCGGCVYDGTPLAGVDIRIDEEDDGTGQILLRGPMLFDGYAHEPRTDAWFATSDRGRWLPDGRLSVVGRMDDMVLSGGINIPLPAVERALRGLAGVADAAVVGVPDDEWGTRVVAAVVPAPGAAFDHAGVRDELTRVGLPRAWAPRQLVLVAEIPLLPNGKTDRLRLCELATS